MGDKDKDQEFKVVDRRGQREDRPAGGDHKGEGFVMKDEPPTGGPGQIDFSALVLSLATGAMLQLGVAPDPVTKKTEVNLEMARQNIEILALLQEKTRGNLTEDENKLIETLLAEIRLKYVEKSRG